MTRRPRVELHRCECKRCGHKWIPRVEEPHFCPMCRSLLWYKTDVEIGDDGRIKTRFTEIGKVQRRKGASEKTRQRSTA